MGTMNKETRIPKWTVHYNIVSQENDEWIGTGREFFDNELDAEKCYNRHIKNGNCPCKRPFYKKIDLPHLGAAHTYNLHSEPKIVCLCGSLRFKELFVEYEYKSVINGEIALLPCCMHVDIEREYGSTSKYKRKVDEQHKRKIDICDEVFVLNKNGYIGESTRSEIDYAVAHGKPVSYLEEVKSCE